jgi:hypothetical protein
MLHVASFARQGPLAAGYRAADVHRADARRAGADARRSTSATLDATAAPRAAIRPLARLLALLPHPR